ncbi:TonB-dependent siderophore receptor [Nitratireductor sp. GCM10026969]|uniref:TonB-dependent siderophore receptor n=1 Tax=Nitratireductor sp. GCM10026969 TaxID=3252645 RepID=UPI00360E1FCA
MTAAMQGRAHAQGQQQTAFNVPAGPLANALAAFGRQAGLQVTYLPEIASGRRSPGVSGAVAPGNALARILQGTGLSYRFTNATTVSIYDPSSADAGAAAVDDGSTLLDRLQVWGESAYGPVDGYKASRSASATKTDTPIIEIPASIEVVSAQVIEEQAAQNLKDVYENVSGVQQAGNTLNAQSEVLPIIRGFESSTLLRNGMRSTSAGTVDLVDVERVEVLKGPGSILYGALEPGGVINYITKRPQQTAAYKLKQEVGSYDFYRATADLTGPLTEDGSLAYRLNAAYTNSGSFRDHMDLERAAVMPSLLWTPTDQTEVLFDLSWTREKQPYDTGIPLSEDGEPLVPISTFVGNPDLAGRDLNNYSASYQLTHEFNDVWSIRNQLQFHRADSENESIRSRGIGNIGGVEVLGVRYQHEERTDDEYQFVLDATAKFATGPVDHELLLGTDLTYQEFDFRRFRQNLAPIPIGDDMTIDFDPPASQPRDVVAGETQWAGLYAQDQMSLLEDGRLKLLVGGRYDIYHLEGVWDGVVKPDVDEQAFTGRTGLLYQFTDQYSAYASVSQSFEPHRADVIDRNGNPVSPEEGLQYEAGIKASFLDDRLLATASVYQIEKKNVAVWDEAYWSATGEDAYFPGVRERSRGFEFDLTGALTDNVNVLANYAYTDSKVLENPGDPASVGGPLGGVPRHAARLWLTYDFGESSRFSGLGFGGGVRYVGTRTAQFDSSLELDPYVVADAALWYNLDNMKFALNVRNLFDREYIARASDRAIAHPGEPLTVTGSLSLRF